MEFLNAIAIHTFHANCIYKYGKGTLGALGWKDQEGQQARFKLLCSIADLNNSSVLDTGCGHGDLRGYLEKQFSGTRYIGIDQESVFLDAAIEKYGMLPNTSFFQGTSLQQSCRLRIMSWP